MRILQLPGWARPRGDANGESVTGRQIFVAGMIGWDGQRVLNSDGLGARVAQALRNAVAVLKEADAGPGQTLRMTVRMTVRMTRCLIDKHARLAVSREIGVVLRQTIGHCHALMTAVQVTALLEDRAQVAIEVTAVVPKPSLARA